MTVAELIQKLQEFNPEAKVVTITTDSKFAWDYTEEPKLHSTKNSFGERVWFQ